MYNVKDNAETKLQVGLSSLATTLVVEIGSGILFPEAPFIAVLNKRDSDGKITKSEKVEVISRDGDQFTITRGFDGTTPTDFNAGDYFSLFVLAKHIQELQERSEYSAKDSSIANEYSNESTYSIGDIVMYKGDRYKCNTTISTAEEFNPSKWTNIPLQSNLSTIENNVSTLQTNVTDIMVNGVPTLSLTKDLFVGETYTKGTDPVMLQILPRGNNCTNGLAIGDVDAHKELHIQNAFSEGTSNVISLKVRKIGSPTTSLIVKVQNGVLYTVTGAERGWTGDGTDIASGSIPYSSITTERQILNITLDQYIGGNSNPSICDIVISQTDGIINADNYYEIAYDNTQFSECFRGIYVNGDSKLECKLMPYISCGGLLNCACVKYEDASYAFGTPEQRDYNHYLSKTSGWAYIDIFSTGVEQTTYLSINHPTWVNRGSYSNPYGFDQNYNGHMNFILEVINENGVVAKEYTFDYDQAESVSVVLPVGWRARTKAYTARTYTGMTAYVTTQTIISTQGAQQKKNTDGVSIFPKNQKSVTNTGTFSITGLVDGDVGPQLFKGDYEPINPFVGTTTSVTTGSITLGTAVGYLRIKVNGSEYKVPYYN